MLSSPAAILFTTVALDLIGFGMVVPLMPLYARSFSVGPQAIAWLLACYSLMQFFFAPVWGALSDRIGRRPVLLASMVGNFVALLTFATAQSFGQLLVSRILAGICTANISVASAYMADITPRHLRARGMGMIGAAFGLGFVLGPFFAGELSTFGLSAPPLAAALLAGLNGLLALWRLPESLPSKLRRKRGSTRLWAILAVRWRAASARPRVLQLLTLMFCHVFGFAMMEMSLTLIVAQRLGFGALYSGRMLAFVGVVLVLVQGVLVGKLSRRYGDGPLFITGLALLALGLGSTATAALFGIIPMLCALAVLALGQGLVSPTGQALLSRSTTAEEQGEVLGLGQSSSAMARVLGPLVAGIVFEYLGDIMPLWVGALVVLVASVGAWSWHTASVAPISSGGHTGRPCASTP